LIISICLQFLDAGLNAGESNPTHDERFTLKGFIIWLISA